MIFAKGLESRCSFGSWVSVEDQGNTRLTNRYLQRRLGAHGCAVAPVPGGQELAQVL